MSTLVPYSGYLRLSLQPGQARRGGEDLLAGAARMLEGDLVQITVQHSTSSMGNLYGGQGKLVEAEKTHQQVLRGYKMALGAENHSHY